MPPSRSQSPCKGYNSYDCTNEDRLLKCQYARGLNREFCRKISEKQLSRLMPIVQRSNENRRKRISLRVVSQFRKNAEAKRFEKISSQLNAISHDRKKKDGKRLERKLNELSKKRSKRIISNALSRRKSQRNKMMTPMSKHYKMVADVRQQPSIYRFRTRCKPFPHPVEIFSKQGLDVPLNKNFTNKLKANALWLNFLLLAKSILPNLLDNQHIYKYNDIQGKTVNWRNMDIKFPKRKYRNDDIIIGLKYLNRGEGAHLVFFEVRMNKGHDAVATVIDPNGFTRVEYRELLEKFFYDIPVYVARTVNINTNEKNIEKKLLDLGFSSNPDNFNMGGYCATISCFFLLDYICTDQWKSRTIDHFVRASQEWLMSPLGNTRGLYSVEAATLRIIIFGKYLAYKLWKFMTGTSFDDPSLIITNITFESHLTNNVIRTIIKTEDKEIQLIDHKPERMV